MPTGSPSNMTIKPSDILASGAARTPPSKSFFHFSYSSSLFLLGPLHEFGLTQFTVDNVL